MSQRFITVDGNEACTSVAYRTNEVIAIYPITPASPMGELADAWANSGRENVWGNVPEVVELQSEGGAAGSVHGSLTTGALTTTFTASQGLLLMLPNMFKIAGELSPGVIHISARTVATHALSIFGDHSDVMACRSSGFAQLASSSVQEAHDMALIAHAATVKCRIPFLHFFDGFRTSHEVNKIAEIPDEQIRAMFDRADIRAHRERGMSPDKPVLRGTAMNPDVFFQGTEVRNPYYDAVSAVVTETMERFFQTVGRRYHLFDYVGAPDAERVLIAMGSGAGAVEEAVAALTARGEKVGMINVHLYRPFSAKHFTEVLPASTRHIAVLDRTREFGAVGEPLYQDVVTALIETQREPMPRVLGGRYGLSSKEFTPAMAMAAFAELDRSEPRRHFTVGINDDVTHLSLEVDASAHSEPSSVVRAVFYGLGSDGTVGANKNSVKIIGEDTDLYAQGYFVYDSRKAGSMTTSHLRFGPSPIRSAYLISEANFIACHQFVFLERIDVLRTALEGATFLLNSPYGPDEVWDHLPREIQQTIIGKKLRFYVIDADAVARAAGMGRRVNTVLQTCFFALAGVLERDKAIAAIKEAIEKTYGKRGPAVLEQNYKAVDAALEHLHEVEVPAEVTSTMTRKPPVPEDAPAFVKDVTGEIIAFRGDELPVSAMPPDGTFPTGTTKYEKRSIALDLPIWDPEICIQCAKCALVCPHATVRLKVYDPKLLEGAPEGFRSGEWKDRKMPGMAYTLQLAPDDCTGCGVCVDVCPAKSKKEVKRRAINMEPKLEHIERERASYAFFQTLPELDRREVKAASVKGSQLLEPLFEFSGACAGCGETPYVKLLSQLFGDRSVIANATGCSSIYGGNLPTTPWTTNKDGRGPTWSNSLFEDNAEFGLGMRLALDRREAIARRLLRKLAPELGDGLAKDILGADQSSEAGIHDQRLRIVELKQKLAGMDGDEDVKDLIGLADALVRKNVWIVGGDGWAYDIGFGGLDHVLALGRDVNILVLDTEVYSNTGGQASKATPRAAVAKFAMGGKPTGKKDLGMLAMAYGHVYVAHIAMGANDTHTIKCFLEAESWPGPSLIIAYSPCIAHGIDMAYQLQHQRDAVKSGYWPLYRYDPRLAMQGKHPFVLDSKKPSMPVSQFVETEARFAMLQRANPERAKALLGLAQADVDERWRLYEQTAELQRGLPGYGEGEQSNGEG